MQWRRAMRYQSRGWDTWLWHYRHCNLKLIAATAWRQFWTFKALRTWRDMTNTRRTGVCDSEEHPNLIWAPSQDSAMDHSIKVFPQMKFSATLGVWGQVRQAKSEDAETQAKMTTIILRYLLQRG